MIRRRATRRRWSVRAFIAGLALRFALAPGFVVAAGFELPQPSSAEPRVILITFDGVRWQEIFDGPDQSLSGSGDSAAAGPLIPFLLESRTRGGVLIGDRHIDSRMRLNNPAGVSLPGYQSLLVGRATLCFSNECGPPGAETILERIRRRLDLAPESVAVFATYPGICESMVSNPGSIPVHCGAENFGALPAAFDPIFNAPKLGPDHKTFAHALHYLEARQPRFLYIALNDTDSMGHASDYDGYLDVMRNYDIWLRELDGVLQRMGKQGEATNIIITTDHGRGRGEEWMLHRMTALGTNEIWLYASGPEMLARGSISGCRTFSHADIAPTIEHLFGLEPTRGLMRGRVIEELFVECGEE